MDCKKVEKVIFRFIYGESGEHELRRIKEHLDRCGECEKERLIIADILEQLRNGLADDPVPAGFRERVLALIHQEAG
ncbi:zf-HC2 domain-containing protein [bacterium]|nr:zf-HC2 domain-containing protein [bacterium]